eukprot:5537560-Pleurochrysis_carterae.AAC.1
MTSERLAVWPSSRRELVARFLGAQVGRHRNIDFRRLAVGPITARALASTNSGKRPAEFDGC